jgi:hypothetical protein
MERGRTARRRAQKIVAALLTTEGPRENSGEAPVGLRAAKGQCETLAEHCWTGIHAGWSNRFDNGCSRNGMVTK